MTQHSPGIAPQDLPRDGLPDGGQQQTEQGSSSASGSDFYLPGPNGGYFQFIGRRPVTFGDAIASDPEVMRAAKRVLDILNGEHRPFSL